jgi:two-component system cell cycle response regulator DivK
MRFTSLNSGNNFCHVLGHRSDTLITENPQPILVIEDQALNRKVTRIVLQSEGYEVIEANDAAEALAYLEKVSPALILMDIALPGQSGEELTRQIKGDPDLCSIPIIALTAAAMSGDRERLLKAGCDDYLSKPIDTRLLLERVAHHLKGSTT